MDNSSNEILTKVKVGYCAFAGRDIPAFFWYHNGRLIQVECPRNGCQLCRSCKLYQSDPLAER